MADLRTNPHRMRELLDHLRQVEGEVPHFYCDARGLVTIGVGHLVDQAGASDVVGRQIARQLAQRPGIRFIRTTGGIANVAEVETDWQRVKDYGRAHAGAPARAYATIAQLRLDQASIRTLLEDTVRPFLATLYQRRPFLIGFDERVAMAFVDVRYNPAGIPLYGPHLEIQHLWEALDPRSSLFDLTRAVTLFERIWAYRGVPRYGQRHWQRVQWIRAGLQSMWSPGAARCL
jgi:hypothetical protein